MEKDQIITIDKFPLGFVSDFGTNKVPEYFAEKAINVRLVNGGISVRNGFIERYTDIGVDNPQGIVGNEVNGFLLFVYNGSVHLINTSDYTATSIGSITSTLKARFINHGRYTIILTGDQKPYRYSGEVVITFNAAFVTSNVIDLKLNGVSMTQEPFASDTNTTLTNLAAQIKTDFGTIVKTSTANTSAKTITVVPVSGNNLLFTDILVTGGASQATATTSKLFQCTTAEIDDGVNPSFGGAFTGFTIINRNDEKNVISVSRPISLTNPGYAKDWKGTNAYTITTKGMVQGMCATLSRFWIFTDRTIEYLTQSFLDATSSYVPITYAAGELLCNPDCVKAAGDIVFYVTKNKRIRSIGYQGTINEPQIKTISDIENAGIQRYLDEELAEDQSLAFIHHDELNNLMKFNFVGIDSNYPDVQLCWDLNANQWLLDLDKQYSGMCTFNTKQYGYSGVGRTIYEDEYGEDDDGNGIEREYETQNMGITEPNVVKMRKGGTIGGQINNESKILVKVYIDGNLYFEKYIDGELENPISLGGVGEFGIGEGGVGEVGSTYTLVDFEKDIDLGRLRKTGKKIKINFSGNEIGQKLIIDYLSLKFKPRQRKRVRDKKFTSI